MGLLWSLPWLAPPLPWEGTCNWGCHPTSAGDGVVWVPPCSLTPVLPIFPGHGPATCPHPPTLAPHSCQHEPGPHRGAGGGHVWSGVSPGLRWGVVCAVGWVMLTWCEYSCPWGLQGWGWPLLLGLQDPYEAPGRGSPWLCAFALSCLPSPGDIGATWALVSSWSFPSPHPGQSWLCASGLGPGSWRGAGGSVGDSLLYTGLGWGRGALGAGGSSPFLCHALGI